MWNDIYRWMIRNSDAINWFVIGWLSMGALQALVIGDYVWAVVDAVLVYANYKLLSIRN